MSSWRAAALSVSSVPHGSNAQVQMWALLQRPVQCTRCGYFSQGESAGFNDIMIVEVLLKQILFKTNPSAKGLNA